MTSDANNSESSTSQGDATATARDTLDRIRQGAARVASPVATDDATLRIQRSLREHDERVAAIAAAIPDEPDDAAE